MNQRCLRVFAKRTKVKQSNVAVCTQGQAIKIVVAIATFNDLELTTRGYKEPQQAK